MGLRSGLLTTQVFGELQRGSSSTFHFALKFHQKIKSDRGQIDQKFKKKFKTFNFKSLNFFSKFYFFWSLLICFVKFNYFVIVYRIMFIVFCNNSNLILLYVDH